MAKKTEFSSIWLTAFQQAFQCGALHDVSDYVVRTTAQTGKSHRSSENVPITTRTTMGEQDESTCTHQDQVPGLQPSHSSASSIYVVPSREALEEMVKESRSTRRQGIFDMDRMFTCGSRESVADDDLDDEDENHMASTSSVFSRDTSRASSFKGPTIQVEDSTRRKRRQDDDIGNVEYHFKIHLSPPRTDMRHKTYTSERNQSLDYSLRKTMSDSLQQLPEAKSADSGLTVKTQPYSHNKTLPVEQRPQ